MYNKILVTMEACEVCSNLLDSNRAINCSGSCGRTFHFVCVGLSKSHFSAWCAKTGLFWFCNSCRLNFEPAVYDREKTIIRALRELLIRTDSMDTRLGNYGENLRKINRTMFGTQTQSKPTNNSHHQASFSRCIDELTLDDTAEDPINRSRSCDDTSFFEVLDEINNSIAQLPDKFVVGSNKRVQIVTNSVDSGVNKTTSRVSVSTPAAPEKHSNISSNKASSTALQQTLSTGLNKHPERNDDQFANRRVARGGPGNTSSIPLKVANVLQPTLDLESFYVTPFSPDQNEDEIKQYVAEISNIDTSMIKAVKLVPRGKNVEDLSFVSFKVTVSRTVSNVVGDSFYWPEGITVREFEPNPKNGSLVRLPVFQ